MIPMRIILLFVNLKGDIESAAVIGIEPAIEKLVFKRQAVAVAIDKDELQKYVGEYELAGMVAKIYLKEDKLYVFVPGQPEYETVPIGKDEFKFKTLDGFSVRFDVNADGKATAVSFVQPNGTFKAMRK